MAYKRISPQPVVEGGTGAITLTGVLTGNGTSAITANTVTQYGTVVAGVSNAVSSIAPSAIVGIPYISQGAAADPTFGTAVVAGGGTGNTTFTAYSIITAGTTATGPFQNVVGLGSIGDILTSAGAGLLPVWAPPATASITITGDTGGPLSSSSFTFNGGTTGLSFNGVVSTFTTTFAGITANAGIVNLGTDATTNAINLGTVSNTGRTINIGNTTGTTGIVEQVGTGNFSLDGVTNSTYTIGASTTTGTIAIGGTAQTGTITLGSSSGTNIVAIGTGAGATTVNIATGATNAKAVNIGTGAVANIIAIGSTTGAAALTLNSGSAGIVATGVASVAVANKNYVTINTVTGALGSDAGAISSITITGDTGGGLTGSSFTFTGGTTGLSFGGAGSTETLTFAGITANGGTVSLATDATTSTINVGTGAGVKTSTFGSTNSTSATTIQSGTGALNVTSTNGALTINSGTGVLGISTDAAATTVNLGTGAGAKTITLGSTNTTSTTNLQSGSGGIKIPAFAEGALVTSSTGVISTVTGTAGYVLTANAAGTAPSFQVAGGGGGMTWTVITADQNAAVNNGYICNKAGLLTLTLPTTAAAGTMIGVTGINTATGWKIAQNASQQIHFGTANTTSGTGGSLASSATRDSIELVCVVADLEWNVLSSIGNITYV